MVSNIIIIVLLTTIIIIIIVSNIIIIVLLITITHHGNCHQPHLCRHLHHKSLALLSSHITIVVITYHLFYRLSSLYAQCLKQILNIARGTTDPGYRVYNLSYLSS